MEWVWTWGGECFGYVEGGDLWTYSGKHVGQLKGSEIYGRSGEYLGEVMNGNRLIKNKAKSSWRAYSFTPYGRRGSHVRCANYLGYAMHPGHKDFPGPDKF